MSDKVKVEKIIVAAASTSLPASGTKFSNDTNAAIGSYVPGAVMLAAGQIGVYAASGSNKYKAVDGYSAANETKLFIAQGRSTANDRNPLPARPYEISSVIDGRSRVEFWGETCRAPRNSASLVGVTGTNIVAEDSTLYALTVAYHGRRTDILNGKTGPAFFPEFTTPDYTALGMAAADATDHLIQNLVYQINSHSYVWNNPTSIENTVAFAIATSDGGAGNAAITAAAGTVAPLVSSIISGAITNIYIGYTSEGVAVTIPNSESIQNTFTDLIANTDLVGGDYIVPVIINSNAGLGYVAGDTVVDVEAFVVMAYDDAKSLAYVDDIPQVKERINVGLRQGFDTSVVTVDVGSYPDEGKGQGRALRLFYESTDGLRKYERTHPQLYGLSINYGNDIDVNDDYNVYAIYHNTEALVSDGTSGEHPHVTIVLIPCDQVALIQGFEDILVSFGNASRGDFGGILTAEAQAERLVLQPTELTVNTVSELGKIKVFNTAGGALTTNVPIGASPGDKFGIVLNFTTNNLTVNFTDPSFVDYAGNLYKVFGATAADATLSADGTYIYQFVNPTVGWVRI